MQLSVSVSCIGVAYDIFVYTVFMWTLVKLGGVLMDFLCIFA